MTSITKIRQHIKNQIKNFIRLCLRIKQNHTRTKAAQQESPHIEYQGNGQWYDDICD